MHKTWYPRASRAQDFSARYVGSVMDPNVVVLHSTEGTGWPGYSSGATAPHFTILPDFAKKTVIVRQHFPVNRSARALENRAGGVQTNTLNAVQIEMVGTCDPATHRKWGSTPHIYMPEAPDWYLKGVADVLAWIASEWEDFPLKDAAPRGWLAYPGSYANGKGQRLSFTEWNNAYGVVGHQHVPENAHGDPGAFPIARTIAFAKGSTPTPPKPTPEPTKTAVEVTSEFLNTAGYNGITAPGVRKWKTNVDGTATRVLVRRPDVFNVAELSNKVVNRMLGRLDDRLTGYSRVKGGSDGRYVYRRKATTDLIASGVFVTPNTKKWRFKKDDKQAAWAIYRHKGALAMDVSCHTENEEGADDVRVAQALYFLDQALATAKKYGVPPENVAIFGDFNSESWVAAAFAERGWKVGASANFVGWDGKSRKRFDLALVKSGVKASGSEVSSRGLSDHNGLTLTRELVLP